jgi:hypothetical protein
MEFVAGTDLQAVTPNDARSVTKTIDPAQLFFLPCSFHYSPYRALRIVCEVGMKISRPYSMHGSGVSSGEANTVSCRISVPTWRMEK